jgi:predicted Zn-dependent protease
MPRFPSILCLLLTTAAFSAGSLAFAHPEVEQRIAEVSALIDQDPGDAGLYLERGRLYHDHGDWEQALSDYEMAADLDPGLERVHLLRAATLIKAGRAARALAVVDEYRRTHPDEGGALVLRARALAALGRSAEAARELREAIESLVGPSIDLHVELARALAADETSGLVPALASLDAAIDRVGPVVSLRLEAVRLSRRAGRFELALPRLESLIGDVPRPARLRVLRGEILAEAGLTEDAVASFRGAVREIDTMPVHVRARPTFAALHADASAAADTLARGGSLDHDSREHDHHHTATPKERP